MFYLVTVALVNCLSDKTLFLWQSWSGTLHFLVIINLAGSLWCSAPEMSNTEPTNKTLASSPLTFCNDKGRPRSFLHDTSTWLTPSWDLFRGRARRQSHIFHPKSASWRLSSVVAQRDPWPPCIIQLDPCSISQTIKWGIQGKRADFSIILKYGIFQCSGWHLDSSQTACAVFMSDMSLTHCLKYKYKQK